MTSNETERNKILDNILLIDGPHLCFTCVYLATDLVTGQEVNLDICSSWLLVYCIGFTVTSVAIAFVGYLFFVSQISY